MIETDPIMLLGVGNLLLSDDGVGVHVVQALQTKPAKLPQQIQILDGGTFGLDLAPRLENIARLVIVDAVHTNSTTPGTVGVWHGEAAARVFAQPMSVHQVGVDALLGALQLLDITPPEVIVVGIEPFSVEPGIELSPAVAQKLPELIFTTIEACWGRC